MKVHILQHEIFESPAVIEKWIGDNKHELTFTKFYEDGKLPGINEIDWLIIMGGPMSVNDEEKYPWLKEEKIFIKKMIDAGKIVLGICLGSQLIAAAMGCKVYPNKYKEIGWMDVNLIENAKHNYLFNSYKDKITVCQWHGHTFDLPEGAILLAESEACRNQAFVYNNKVFGLQFHLEFNEETIRELIRNCRNDLIKDKYVQTGEEILSNLQLMTSTNKILFDLLNKIQENAKG